MNDKTIIAVFCYKRAAKLQRSIEALLKNPECAGMEVVFFCDGPKGEQDYMGVMQTRHYIDNLTGFKQIHKQYREKNISTGPNFQQGITWLCNNYDRFIVVEDDLVVSPNYISYLLQALNFYHEEASVFCITGFCFPLQLKDYQYHTTMHTRFCSYGWASWSNKVKHVQWSKESLKDKLSSAGFTSALNEEGKDLSRMVVKQVNGTISTWDIQMQVHVASYRLKVVYPILSKTYNIGFDQESTNTFGIDYLKTIVDEGTNNSFSFCPADLIVLSLQSQLRKPYSFPALASRKIINTFIKYTNKIRAAALN